MPARALKLMEHALAEIQVEHELLIRKHERLAGENKRLRAEVKRLKVRLAELESGRVPPPPRGG